MNRFRFWVYEAVLMVFTLIIGAAIAIGFMAALGLWPEEWGF